MEIPILVIIAIVIYYIFKGKMSGDTDSDDSQPREPQLLVITPQEEELIKNRMTYYHLLEKDEQIKFLTRTVQLRESLKFVSREEGFDVTDEMRILVSASLAQLTFGWTELKPPHLEQIDLFSESFYSRLVEADVKGLTFPNRVMLSWRYFQEGYQIDNDKVNLGLHELAHSVWDEGYWDEKVKDTLDQWAESAADEFGKMQRHVDCGFFREYAATNTLELWACSVECFFEAPIEFQQRLPEVYESLAAFINQDMVGRMRRRPVVETIEKV